MRYSEEDEKAIVMARAHEKQWKYWGPVAIAPIPFICVSLYRNAKTPIQKQLLVGVGMIGIPIAMWTRRVYLMNTSTAASQQQDGFRQW